MTLPRILACGLLLILANPCLAMPAPTAVPAGTAVQLPAINFIASDAQQQALLALQAHPALATTVRDDLPGSPLQLMMTMAVEQTAGGTAGGLLSLLVSSASLGIIPMISHDRLVLRYDLHVQGQRMRSHRFERSAARAENFWTHNPGGGQRLLKGEELAWLQHTAAEVATLLAADPALQALASEQQHYQPAGIAPPAPPAAQDLLLDEPDLP